MSIFPKNLFGDISYLLREYLNMAAAKVCTNQIFNTHLSLLPHGGYTNTSLGSRKLGPIFFTPFCHTSLNVIPASIYLLKVNNRNTRTRCEICLKLAINTPDLLVSLSLSLNIFHTLLKRFYF